MDILTKFKFNFLILEREKNKMNLIDFGFKILTKSHGRGG